MKLMPQTVFINVYNKIVYNYKAVRIFTGIHYMYVSFYWCIYIYSVIRRAWKRVENLQREIQTSSNEAYSVHRMKYEQICEAENNRLVYSEVRRVESHDNSEYVSTKIQSNNNTNFIATVNEAYGIIRGPSEKTQK